MSFTVYKSSAGSGKTFTLVLEYLKLVLPEPWRFRHILAITFTNKAANEMKERVIKNLTILSQNNSDNSLLELLSVETGLSPQLVSEKAGEALTLILHNYSDFAIGTIDAFSHRIVRSFARDLGLPVNFLVTLESESLRKEAVDMLLNKAGQDKELTSLLVHFLESMIDENNRWDIEEIMTTFSKVLEDEETEKYLGKLRHLGHEDFMKISGRLRELCDEISRVLIEPGKKFAAQVIESGVSPSSFFRWDKGFYAYMMRISRGDLKNIEPKTFVKETVEQDKWYPASSPLSDQEIITKYKAGFLDLYEEFQTMREEKVPVLRMIQLLRKTIYPLGVLNLLDSLFSEYKKENNLVQISEFNRRISSLIADEPVPFVYERLGERYRYILIDEFQDTSKMQWENLLPLVENSLGTGSLNLVVGDGKQAIYRWRNGEVEQFINLPKVNGSETRAILKDREKSLVSNFIQKNLDRNYRSRKDIVEFNNSFFGFTRDAIQQENALVYKDCEQKADEKKQGGFVSVEFMEKNNDDAAFARILDIISETEKLNFSHGDIAILCRNNQKASATARFLMNNGISVISAESLLLCFSDEVRFMINCFKLITDPGNVFTRAEILSFLHKKKKISGTLPEILGRFAVSSRSFNEILTEAGFSLDTRKLSMLPLYDICEEILRIFNLHKTAGSYIQFFLDAVLEFSRMNPDEVNVFLEWWELQKKKLSVVVPDGVNAVNVMTVHKAKGLQFPVVIFPFANQYVRSTKSYLWIDLPSEGYDGLPVAMVKPEKAMQETPYADLYDLEMQKSELDLVNLLYVAFTRPEEALYILTETPSKESNGLTVPGLLRDYLSNKEIWKDQVCTYTFGELSQRDSGKKKSGNILNLENFISEDYRKKIRIKTNAPMMWDTDDPQRSRSRGNLVHSLLAGIRSSADNAKVISNAVAAGLIPTAKAEEFSLLIDSVTGNPEIAEYFSGNFSVLNEAEILSEGESNRPDRIVIAEDGTAVIIDYKTGKPDEHYHQQLKKYEKLLNELGYRVSKKLLVFTEPEVKVTEVF